MSNYYEDIPIGEPVELGSHRFAADEIIRFARRFDPQAFHLDEEAAKNSLFGGLCASGWHTGSMLIRKIVDHRQRLAAEITAAGERPACYGPSPGFRDLKWLKPVYAGDVIHFRTQVREKNDLRSRPNLGMLVSLNEGFNQKGELVVSFVGQIFVERREPAE